MAALLVAAIALSLRGVPHARAAGSARAWRPSSRGWAICCSSDSRARPATATPTSNGSCARRASAACCCSGATSSIPARWRSSRGGSPRGRRPAPDGRCWWPWTPRAARSCGSRPPRATRRTPSHQELGEANDVALTEIEARRIAAMLRAAGIGWDLAPVVDVGLNPENTVIVGNGRSFGADAARVTAHARAFIEGMHAEAVLTALKHFPGHGSSVADSHLGFVDVTDTASPGVELAPYRALLAERRVDAVMTAHVFNRRARPALPRDPLTGDHHRPAARRARLAGARRQRRPPDGRHRAALRIRRRDRAGAGGRAWTCSSSPTIACPTAARPPRWRWRRWPARSSRDGSRSTQIDTALARVDALRARQRLAP